MRRPVYEPREPGEWAYRVECDLCDWWDVNHESMSFTRQKGQEHLLDPDNDEDHSQAVLMIWRSTGWMLFP